MSPLPVDRVFGVVQRATPGVTIERLIVTHPGDDDNVWRLSVGPQPWATGQRNVQIDTAPGGTPPFLVEGDDEGQRLETSDPAEAAEAILRWL
jgi:hypothetical protein